MERYDSGVIVENATLKLNTTALYRYMFHHYDDFKICKTVCDELLSTRQSKYKDTSPTSTFDLYSEIAKHDLFSKLYYSNICGQLQLDSLNIPSLQEQYKANFEPESWAKIKLFEWHFSKFISENLVSYGKLQERKLKFFKLCQDLKSNGDIVNNDCRKTLQVNKKRKAAGEALSGIVLDLDLKHRREIIEKEIKDLLSEHAETFEAARIICFDCSPKCTHSRGLHICIEAKPSHEYFDDVSVLIRAHIQKKHFIYVPVLIFLQENSISSQRFSVRDQLESGKLSDHVHTALVETKSPLDDEIPTDLFIGSNICRSCFLTVEKHVEDPLDVDHFSICHEWGLHTPLPVQIFLEAAFINKDSIKNSQSPELYIGKLLSLYSSFEACQSILNKKHNSLLQEIRTDDLMINFHNITDVFSLTAATHITQSLRTGDRRLRRASDPDFCYYNTYLKKHPLMYTNVDEAEQLLHSIDLRKCHLIFCVDNLVGLTMKNDPPPGVKRSNQICTLPITVIGVPQDAAITQRWHQPHCHFSTACNCKDPSTLSKTDVDRVLLTRSHEEEEAWQSFQISATWGLRSFWNNLVKSTLFRDLLPTAKEAPSDVTILDDLDVSMASLNLGSEDVDIEDISVDQLNISDEASVVDKELKGACFFPAKVTTTGYTDTASMDNQVFEETTLLPLSTTESGLEESILQTQSLNKFENILVGMGTTEDDSLTNVSAIKHDMQNNLMCETTYEELNNEDQFEVKALLDDIDEYISSSGDFSPLVKESPFTDQNESDLPVPLICRHPPPASGRDDDIAVLRNILDDFLEKAAVDDHLDRVLTAPDYKVAKNLLALIDSDIKYRTFLPEFPVLHLRKSKITNLISAYETTGLIHILKYMKDDDTETDCSNLVSIGNIEIATRNIWRLSAGLHVALIFTFMTSISQLDAEQLSQDLCHCSEVELELRWGCKLKEFIITSSKKNATFSLHLDLMKHCDEIVAIACAERFGGSKGYNLLLASVKSSLPFSFVNSASSYAGFCTRLLIEHYQASPFHQSMKRALFSIPHNGSQVKFGLDTVREIDHRVAKKSIRPAATLENVLPKMSSVDHQMKIQIVQKLLRGDVQTTTDETESTETDEQVVTVSADRYTGKKITQTDLLHIYRTTRIILKRKAMSTDEDKTPRNVYHKFTPELPNTILDKETTEVANYLIQKYSASQGFFGMDKSDCPDVETVVGPKPLISKLKRSKGTTINRTKSGNKQQIKSAKEQEEKKRKEKVKKLTSVIDCMSSSMNTCQSIMRPDGSKAPTNKSLGIKRALTSLVGQCLGDQSASSSRDKRTSNTCDIVNMENLIQSEFKTLPESVARSAKVSVVEFAGLKFRAFVSSGNQYIQYVTKAVLLKLANQLPNVKHIIICEEKYSFTPDLFKADTRKKREKLEKASISHLKEESEIISQEQYNKPSVTGTAEGKLLISSYLGQHVKEIVLNKDIILDIDSEALSSTCECDDFVCSCEKYSIPLRAQFSQHSGLMSLDKLTNIKQKKGEAELAQMDWMKEIIPELSEGDSVLNYVTSADIDTLVIHIFAISLNWPRKGTPHLNFPSISCYRRKIQNYIALQVLLN